MLLHPCPTPRTTAVLPSLTVLPLAAEFCPFACCRSLPRPLPHLSFETSNWLFRGYFSSVAESVDSYSPIRKQTADPREPLHHHLLPSSSSSSSERRYPLSTPLHPPAFLRFIQTQFSLLTAMPLHGSVRPFFARLSLAFKEHRLSFDFSWTPPLLDFQMFHSLFATLVMEPLCSLAVPPL